MLVKNNIKKTDTFWKQRIHFGELPPDECLPNTWSKSHWRGLVERHSCQGHPQGIVWHFQSIGKPPPVPPQLRSSLEAVEDYWIPDKWIPPCKRHRSRWTKRCQRHRHKKPHWWPLGVGSRCPCHTVLSPLEQWSTCYLHICRMKSCHFGWQTLQDCKSHIPETLQPLQSFLARKADTRTRPERLWRIQQDNGSRCCDHSVAQQHSPPGTGHTSKLVTRWWQMRLRHRQVPRHVRNQFHGAPTTAKDPHVSSAIGTQFPRRVCHRLRCRTVGFPANRFASCQEANQYEISLCCLSNKKKHHHANQGGQSFSNPSISLLYSWMFLAKAKGPSPPSAISVSRPPAAQLVRITSAAMVR